MNYSIINLDEYDKALKIDNKKILCYSPKEYKNIEEEKEIIGEVNNYEDNQNAETVLVIGKKSYEVLEPGKTSKLLYACRGYIAVGENQYIALFRSRVPFLLWLLGLLGLFVLAIVMILSIGLHNPEADPEPVFHPLPPIDSSAEPVSGEENKTPSDVGEGGGKVNMTYSTAVTLVLGTGQIDISFMNPGDSSHDIVLELYVVSEDAGKEQKYKIAESGRIPAGNQLTSMKFTADPAVFEGEGIYKAQYCVKYYDSKTGEKSLLDATLDEITLTVKK